MTIAMPKIPPSPATPWFGMPLMRALLRDPLKAVQELQAQYGEVMHLRMPGQSFYYLFSPELIRQALLEHAGDLVRHERSIDVFTRIYGANVLTTESDSWQRQRRILMPGFRPKKIAGYLDLMRGAMDDSEAAWFPRAAGESGVVNVGNFARKVAVDVILSVLFGHRTAAGDSEAALQATLTLEHQAMRELYWPKAPPDWMPYPGKQAKLQARAVLQELIGKHIRARQAAGAAQADNPDYLAMLMSAQDEQAQDNAAALTTEEIRDNCMVIFAAGHDTTATVLTWWIALMTQHPEAAARARQEIAQVLGERAPAPEDLPQLAWLNATLKEAMRLYPPTPILFVRRSGRDLDLGGWRIPARTNITVPVWHVHRDARWFAEPESFRPERFLPGAPDMPRGAWLPFGTGPRVCIGQHLAMMELALIATQLLRNFDFAFADGQGMPKAVVNMVLSPERDLLVRFTRVRRNGA